MGCERRGTWVRGDRIARWPADRRYEDGRETKKAAGSQGGNISAAVEQPIAARGLGQRAPRATDTSRRVSELAYEGAVVSQSTADTSHRTSGGESWL